MKPAKLRSEDNFVDEILEALRFVPKSRLRIVREVVGALIRRPPAANARSRGN